MDTRQHLESCYVALRRRNLKPSEEIPELEALAAEADHGGVTEWKLFLQGRVFQAREQHEEALGAFEAALRGCPDFCFAMFGRAVSLGELKRPQQALAIYDEVVTRFAKADDPLLRRQAAQAWVNKGVTLGELKRPEEEIAAYDEVLLRFGEAKEPDLRKQAARAVVNKGITLGELKRPEEEIAAYDEVVLRFGEATEPELREQVARSLLLKGVRLGEVKRPEEAVATYEEVVRRFGEATEPELRTQVARALLLKGARLGDLKGPEETVAAYDEVVRRFQGDSSPQVCALVGQALAWKGYYLASQKKDKEARAALRKAKHVAGSDPLVQELSSLAIKRLSSAPREEVRRAKEDFLATARGVYSEEILGYFRWTVEQFADKAALYKEAKKEVTVHGIPRG